MLMVCVCCLVYSVFYFCCRHKFVNNELIVKSGLVDKRKVRRIYVARLPIICYDIVVCVGSV